MNLLRNRYEVQIGKNSCQYLSELYSKPKIQTLESESQENQSQSLIKIQTNLNKNLKVPQKISNDIQEFLLLEFQGEFDHTTLTVFDNEILGTLQKDNKKFQPNTSRGSQVTQETYLFECEMMQLRGQIVDLKQPILVTEKIVAQDKIGEEKQVEFKIIGVIKRKIQFNQRPVINKQKALLNKKAN
ncbi:hypothetical protein OXYTRIMIC_059 [Oxytricha trifallax]|uniref:Chromosome transmission fidelity protein 8 n=1 Tax=Oxytricha trifallax TaxID=1172189 RepID=A0A073I0C7_9SPIT|nr:hypothetical protein OXYTRIMIC_059 [Oxytricha trifallax]